MAFASVIDAGWIRMFQEAATRMLSVCDICRMLYDAFRDEMSFWWA
jgi:hypothetical protein